MPSTNSDRISFDNVTVSKIDGSGYFDRLMTTLRLHVNDAVTNNEITQAEAGAVYTGVIPSLINEAVKFEMAEQLTEEKLVTEVLQQEKLRQSMRLDERRTIDGEKTGDATRVQIKASTDKVIKDIQLAERQVVDQELTSKLQREQLAAAISDASVITGLKVDSRRDEHELQKRNMKLIEVQTDDVIYKTSHLSVASYLHQLKTTEEMLLNNSIDRDLKSSDLRVKKYREISERILAGHSKYNILTGKWADSDTVTIDRTAGFFQLEKLANQDKIHKTQVKTTELEYEYKEPSLERDLAQKTKMMTQMQVDIDFNIAKREVMIAGRNDTLRIAAATQYAEFMKYLSAANMIPASKHFANQQNLISNILSPGSMVWQVKGPDTEKGNVV